MRRVLLTGGSGLIGKALVPALRAAGWKTRCLVHRSQINAAEEKVAGDLRDRDSLRAAAADVDAVIHLAAVTHARRRSEYSGSTSREPATWSQRSTPLASPAWSWSARVPPRRKVATTASRSCAPRRSCATAASVHRPPPPRGLRHRQQRGGHQIVSRAARGAPIPLVGAGAQRICPIDLDDAISPIVNAVESEDALGRTYTLAGECLTVREFAAACVGASATESRIVAVPRLAVRALCQLSVVLPLPLAPDQLQRLEGPKPEDSAAARDQLGFRPRPLIEGLHEHCRPSR